ncbi:MAG: cyclic pyranopterin monophosphate synthase MoaC [Candidatus Eisenbacteria bacterium]|nr:cyclic pyranopterin monophosphate synthase MoaC [Candidatus Eisenbacteria bacterium]
MSQKQNKTRPGSSVRMVDVSAKEKTLRTAVATGKIFLSPKTLETIEKGLLPKGDVLTVSRVAGIMAAKRTSELIPMCHPIALSNVSVELHSSKENSCIEARAIAKAVDRTGAEMESLVAVTVSLLTICDMCKQVDKDMVIGEIALIEKAGGRSGHYKRKSKTIGQ